MIPYLDMHFASAKPQDEDFDSTVFSFHSIMFVEFLLNDRVTFFFDHLVRVTRSSIWTSLISRSEKQLSLSLTCCVDRERVNVGLVLLGEEDLLSSGLVWVAASFLEIIEAKVVAESSVISTCSPEKRLNKKVADEDLPSFQYTTHACNFLWR